MKKFGTRSLKYTSEEPETGTIFDEVYESEMSKKLNYTYGRDNFEGKFIKTKKRAENKTLTENSARVKYPEIKRLSELEDSNLYFTLKICENASKEEIKRAYRILCFQCHPDKGGDSENFNRINKAYQILSNETTRKLYDSFSNRALTLIEEILHKDPKSDIDFDLADTETLEVILKISNKTY
jgi:hypothetical protein